MGYYIMANIYYLRKLAQDELYDTMFFASGERPNKEKTKDFTILSTNLFEAKIFSNRKILINSNRFNTIHEAKSFIQWCLK